MKGIVFAILLIALPLVAKAEIDCFTWSNEILFKAVGNDETKTTQAVIAACIDYPYVNPADCTANVQCFNQVVNLPASVSSAGK